MAERSDRFVRKLDPKTGVISLFAGNGSRDPSGDGGSATLAGLSFPTAVTVGPSGTVYIADTYAFAIRKVDMSTGLISSVAQTSGDNVCPPTGIAIDPLGRLVVSCLGGSTNRIMRFDPATGIWTALASSAIALHAGLAVDDAGAIYFSEPGARVVRKILAETGAVVTYAGNGREEYSGDGGPATGAGLSLPSDLALDANGDLLIADAWSNRIRKVDTRTGIIITVAGSGSEGFSGDGGPATLAALAGPQGVTSDGRGGFFFVDDYNYRVRHVDSAGGTISTVAGTGASYQDELPASQVSLYSPSSVSVTKDGQLLIAERTGGSRVRKVDLQEGIIRTLAGSGNGGDGGPASTARLYDPRGLAEEQDGSILVTDGSLIRRIDRRTGLISTLADANKPTAPPTPSALIGVAVARHGGIAVADSNNFRVIDVEPTSGVLSRAAGNGLSRFYIGDGGDGGPAASAFAIPGPLAADQNSVVFVDKTRGRIRRIDRFTGIVRTVAGSGVSGFSGDGGPATAATLKDAGGLAFTPQGDLLIADTGNGRIRKVDLKTGVITTLFGTGATSWSDNGDGKPATFANLLPYGLAVSPEGHLFIAEGGLSVRRIDARTGIISTVAGGGSTAAQAADGGPATAAAIAPIDVSLDRAGDLFVADLGQRVWRVDRATGVIRLVAGSGSSVSSGDGGAATTAGFAEVSGVRIDVDGTLLISESRRVRRVDLATGLIRTVAGGGHDSSATDGTPATTVAFCHVNAIEVTPSGDLIVADGGWRIWQVARATGGASRLLGVNDPGFAGIGDGLPATNAGLAPSGVAFEPSGGLLIADRSSKRVRRVDRSTGVIQTFAGNGRSLCGDWRSCAPQEGAGDGGPATCALMDPVAVAVGDTGDVLIADQATSGIRRVDARSGIISSVAGNGAAGFSGDGGPATAASLNLPDAVAVTAEGDIFIADTRNSRIRAVFACRDRLGPFGLSYPQDGFSAAGGTLNVGWTGAASAFRYDVLLDTRFPPQSIIAKDVAGKGTRLEGLSPGKTYYWQVRAKGDPYCPPLVASSTLRRFTTPNPCRAPAPPVLGTPAVGAGAVLLPFEGGAETGAYDIYVGPVGSPPRLVALGLTAGPATLTELTPGTAYRWRVTAHASCDPQLTTSSSEGHFTSPGECPAPATVALVSPSDAASDARTSQRLEWTAAPGASSYDVYLGEGAVDPTLIAGGLTQLHVPVELNSNTRYRWMVVAHAGCNNQLTSSSRTSSFRTSSCGAPAVPTWSSPVPSAPQKGGPYPVAWRPAPDLGPGGFYRLERSNTPTFSAPGEVFTTAETSLVLPPSNEEAHHRVVAVAACGSASAPSPTLSLSPGPARASITVLRSPRSLVIPQTAAGATLPELELLLRNIGAGGFTGFLTTSQTVPFFTLSETLVALRPGELRMLYVRLSGVPGDRPGQYEGLISVVSSDPSDTAAYPQVPVSLVVADLKTTEPISPAAPPQLLLSGAMVDSVSFRPSQVGEVPPDVQLDLKNPGPFPLHLAAEALPDPWVSLEPGWNATPIPPGGTRTVSLRCERMRGEAGGTFPRFTYLTFRTIGGESSRLLVEDPGLSSAGACPGRSTLGPAEWSLLVPAIVNAPSRSGGRYVSQVLLTNIGPDPLQADLYYTPDTGDPLASGYDLTFVRHASVLVPGHDVVALRDPLRQLFGTDGSGSLEIRSSRIGLLRVQSVVDAPAAGGGSFGFQLPTVKSGEGARPNVPHVALGVREDSVFRTNLILTETSGQPASVNVTLYDKTGNILGSTRRVSPPYSKQQLSLADLTGGRSVSAGAVEITAVSGSAGTVAGILTVIDGKSGDASSFLARPLTATTRSSSLALASVVVSPTFKSRVEVRNNDVRPLTYTLSYRGGAGALTSQPRTLQPKTIDAFNNVLGEAFNLPATSFGPLAIVADSPNVSVTSRVYAEMPSGTYGDAIEGIALDDPTTTGDSGRMLVVDGLEGTADNDRSRGARTNLILTEIAGKPVELEVALWEKSQKRVAPIGTMTIALGAHEQRQINDVFGDNGIGFGAKDRLNVLCTIRPKAGAQGRVIALATRIDNLTNDTKNFALRP